MSDEIIGTAILDRVEEPHRLLFLARYADGRHRAHDIPVYPDGAPKTVSQQWKYQIAGDVLHATPSVHIVGEFHNGASWSVKWVEWKPDEYGSHRQQLDAVNPGIKR